jgi:hypothetical protein
MFYPIGRLRVPNIRRGNEFRVCGQRWWRVVCVTPDIYPLYIGTDVRLNSGNRRSQRRISMRWTRYEKPRVTSVQNLRARYADRFIDGLSDLASDSVPKGNHFIWSDMLENFVNCAVL